MTDQLTSRPSPFDEPPDPSTQVGVADLSRSDKIKSELMAGGAVTEHGDDDLAGGWRGALSMAAIAGLFVWLAALNIWWFLFVVGVVISIFLHELGHFATAKWTGMKATQFFLFFGPRLWSFRRGETEYGVRAIPAGAFVRIVGMNKMDDVEPEDEDRTYRSKSFPRRLLVISAGSIMHMIIAVALLFVVYVGQGERTDQFAPGVEISALSADGPALEAGLLPGDEFVTVDGVPIVQTIDVSEAVGANDPGDVVDVVVLRDGAELAFSVELGVFPDGSGTRPLLGVTSGQEPLYEQHGIVGSAVNAVTDIGPVSWESVKGVVKALNPVNIVSHLTGDNDDLATRPTSVVGVTGVADDIGAAEGIYGVLWLLAVLNVFVGVFNMFPLLPLDGGHAAVAVYERVREGIRGGKERYFADVERLMPFAMGVMVLLLTLFTAALYLDITDPL